MNTLGGGGGGGGGGGSLGMVKVYVLVGQSSPSEEGQNPDSPISSTKNLVLRIRLME